MEPRRSCDAARMGLQFGWDDRIECIEPVKVTGEGGEELCLAYKTSKLFVGGGVYLRDEGYVLGVPGKHDIYYPWPDQQKVEAWQAASLVPSPLPAYSIPVIEYLVGYSLWLIIAVMVAFSLGKRWATKRRHARDASTPISLGPPRISTDGDRFINETVTKMLRPGEQVQHQAFAAPNADNTPAVMFLALTTQRLIVIHSQRKMFKVVHEAKSVEEVPRELITSAKEESYVITLGLNGGGQFEFVVPKSEKDYSNQVVFIRDVPRILSKASAAVGPAVAVVA